MGNFNLCIIFWIPGNCRNLECAWHFCFETRIDISQDRSQRWRTICKKIYFQDLLVDCKSRWKVYSSTELHYCTTWFQNQNTRDSCFWTLWKVRAQVPKVMAPFSLQKVQYCEYLCWNQYFRVGIFECNSLRTDSTNCCNNNKTFLAKSGFLQLCCMQLDNMQKSNWSNGSLITNYLMQRFSNYE